MKKSLFFSKIRRSEASNGARLSRLRLETLEERQLLSVTDVASLVFADSIANDAQCANVANEADSVVDIGSVLNTTATWDGSSVTITETDVINWLNRNASGLDGNTPELEGLEGFSFDGTTVKVNSLNNSKTVEKLHITAVPEGVSSITLGSGGFAGVYELYANNLGLSGLNVSVLSNLFTLECRGNQLTELDLGGNGRLTSVICSHNNLTELDLSGNGDLNTLTVDYDVERLFLGRQPVPTTSRVSLSLEDVPTGASVQVTGSDGGVISPSPNTSYQYVLIGVLPNATSPTHRDSIHVTVNGELAMAINPLFKLREKSGSVYAVIDDNSVLTQLDLFKAVPTSTLAPNNVSVPITVGDLSVSIVNSNSASVDNPTSYVNVQNVESVPSLFYKGGLAPGNYTVTVTANKRQSTETFNYALTVNAAKLDTPEDPETHKLTVTNRGVDSITINWPSATCTYDDDGDPETPDVAKPVSNVVYYFRVNGEIYTVNNKPYVTRDASFTATGLAPDTSYTMDVVASHYLSLPEDIDLTAIETTINEITGEVELTGYVKDMLDSDAGTATAFTTGSSIVVTLAGEDSDSTNDFNVDGTSKNVSLREAYGYINKYYAGTGWEVAPEDNIVYNEAGDYAGLYTYTISETTNGTTTAKTYAVVKTIKFDKSTSNPISSVYLENGPIAVDKTFVIDGNVGEGQDGQIVSVKINGANPNPTLAEGQSFADYVKANASRVFEINGTGAITANNVVLQYGYATQRTAEVPESDNYGGAIYIKANGSYVANGGGFENNTATKYGGAVYVETNGTLTVNGASFSANTSTRGGAIWNKGDVEINGAASFIGNKATTGENANNGSFGGAIYNAGNGKVTITGTSTTSPVTFQNNEATASGDVYAPNNVLKGYSGGAIYNTGNGEVSVENAEFTNNSAGKYGGAISNFATLSAKGSTFQVNVASSGGAIQNAGSATINGCDFTSNAANKSSSALGTGDYGGNGGAVFQSNVSGSQTTSTLALNGSTFTGNTAKNAGGALDNISGKATFGGTFSFSGNKADVVGGAIVFASDVANDTFASGASFTFADSNSAAYGKTVAATCRYVGNEATALKAGFFGSNTTVDNSKFDTFVRSRQAAKSDTISFAYLADAAGVIKDSSDNVVNYGKITGIYYSTTPNGPFTGYVEEGGTINVKTLAGSASSVDLYYYISDGTETSYSQYLFKLTMSFSSNANVGVQRINLDNFNGLAANAVGFTFTSFGDNPVSKWRVYWDYANNPNDYKDYVNYGYSLNAFKWYEDENVHNVALEVFYGDSTQPVNFGVVGKVKGLKASTENDSSLSVLDEAFADSELLDDSFIQ